MAQNTNVESQYNGSVAGEVFVQAFKKSDTIKKEAITVLPNNIGTGHLPTLSYDADLQPYACGFTPEGDVEYKDKEVTLRKFKIDNEFCKDEFHQTFQAQKAGLFSAHNEIPTDIKDAILMAIIENLGSKVEDYIWRGMAGQYEGLISELEGDTTVNNITGTAITASNVVDALNEVYEAIPEAILEEKDLVISVSPNVARAYRMAQASMGINTTVAAKELDFLGIRMESLSGLPSNTIVAYRVKNFGFLTGLENDLNEVRVKDMDEYDLSGFLRTKVVLEIGVGYSFGDEVVLYSGDGSTGGVEG